MSRSICLVLIFTLALNPLVPLFASEANHTELLGQLSLQQHYEDTLRRRAEQRYNLQLEKELLERAAQSGQLNNAENERLQQIDGAIALIDRSVQSNQEQLLTVQQEIETIRYRDFGETGSLEDERLSVTIGAANAANSLNSFTALQGIPGQITGANNPTTGVIARTGNTISTIERWKDGKYYRVTRYSSGPNQGRFAPGGRQEIPKSEIRRMGTELKAQQIKGLNQSIANSSTRVNGLKQELKNATTKEAKTQIRGKIDRLNKVQSELKAELKVAKSSPVTNFVKSGSSFAAMSVAITGGYNLIQQAIANDGDLTDLDYKAAFKFISTEEFWAGTAGSFTGAMIGAALTSFLPGPFKVLGAIAGASVGHQFATGTWRDTDWTAVAAQTIGSTIGFFLGAFVGSFMGPFAPIAVIAFSIIGSYLADMALKWMRTQFTPQLTGIDLSEMRSEEISEVEAFAEMVPDEELSRYKSMPEDDLRRELWLRYHNHQMLQEVGTELENSEQIQEWKANLRTEWVHYQAIRDALAERKQKYFSEEQPISAP